LNLASNKHWKETKTRGKHEYHSHFDGSKDHCY
jgi:hypothetical protein